MASPHEMAHSTGPDERLAAFTGDGRFAVDRWLRAEHLAEDFLAFVSEFGAVSEAQRRAIADLARVHGSATQGYDHRIDTGSRRSRCRRSPPTCRRRTRSGHAGRPAASSGLPVRERCRISHTPASLHPES